MNALRLLVVALVLCVLNPSAPAREEKADNAKLLVGKWEATKTDPGTLPTGAIVEFTKDGKLIVTGKDKEGKEIKHEGTYKVEGNSFSVTVKSGDEEKTQTITITKISDKELHTKNQDGKVVELKRTK
jgi:uncharacterized protein (TIGR03066 family)